ncbi:hypothetical protein RUND412_010295 [Rhizina undulata]
MASLPPSNPPSHPDSAGAPEPTAAPPPPTLSLPVSKIVADIAAVTVQEADYGDDPAEISALEKEGAELEVGIAKARDGADEDGEVSGLRKEVEDITAVVEGDVLGEEDEEIAALEKDLVELEAGFRTSEENKTAQEKKDALT